MTQSGWRCGSSGGPCRVLRKSPAWVLKVPRGGGGAWLPPQCKHAQGSPHGNWVFSGRGMDTRQPKSNKCLLQMINSLAILKYCSVWVNRHIQADSHGHGSQRTQARCSLQGSKGINTFCLGSTENFCSIQTVIHLNGAAVCDTLWCGLPGARCSHCHPENKLLHDPDIPANWQSSLWYTGLSPRFSKDLHFMMIKYYHTKLNPSN